MIRTKQQRRRNRRKIDQASPPAVPNATVLTVTVTGGTQVTIVFDQAVMISGSSLPTSWTFGTGAHAITALVSTTGTSYVFTVGGSVASSQVYAMPGNDPAARTSGGGFVSTSNGVMA